MPTGNGSPETLKPLCPFLGMVVVPSAAGPIVRGPQDLTLNIQMNGCVEHQCMFWQAADKSCSIKRGVEAVVALSDLAKKHEGKLSLLGLFGKKG